MIFSSIQLPLLAEHMEEMAALSYKDSSWSTLYIWMSLQISEDPHYPAIAEVSFSFYAYRDDTCQDACLTYVELPCYFSSFGCVVSNLNRVSD